MFVDFFKKWLLVVYLAILSKHYESFFISEVVPVDFGTSWDQHEKISDIIGEIH